jgi:hypothetical protein
MCLTEMVLHLAMAEVASGEGVVALGNDEGASMRWVAGERRIDSGDMRIFCWYGWARKQVI